MRGLAGPARQHLDTYLLPDSRRPVVVALSGGGDSVALTLLADAWARDVGRELLILTVDHGLQAASANWTKACAEIAARLHWPFRALAWTGDKPTTGLPAAARHARHRLLADAARDAGAHVILLGHTADDVAEAAAMREAGATTPSPRLWSPSPVWPEGRGIHLLRPLLGARRADLRAWLTDLGQSWIDDPANLDLRYARSRARATGVATVASADATTPLDLAAHASEQSGVISIPRAAMTSAALLDAHRFIGLAAVCAGGGERLPAATRVARAADALRGDAPFVSTLAGARVEADSGTVRFVREAGEAARGGLASVRAPTIWDGRFEICEPGNVRRLAGLAKRLSPDEQGVARCLPPAARGGLPVFVDDGTVRLAPFTSLVGERLRAAAGLVQREPA